MPQNHSDLQHEGEQPFSALKHSYSLLLLLPLLRCPMHSALIRCPLPKRQSNDRSSLCPQYNQLCSVELAHQKLNTAAETVQISRPSLSSTPQIWHRSGFGEKLWDVQERAAWLWDKHSHISVQSIRNQINFRFWGSGDTGTLSEDKTNIYKNQFVSSRSCETHLSRKLSPAKNPFQMWWKCASCYCEHFKNKGWEVFRWSPDLINPVSAMASTASAAGSEKESERARDILGYKQLPLLSPT